MSLDLAYWFGGTVRRERKARRQRERRRKLRLEGRFLCGEPLEPRTLLAANPIISEFLALNQNSIDDQDGDDSDWIEIYNAGDQAVNLQGWSLTDDSDDLDKWHFPSTNLPAGGYLVVFASNKDRAVSGQQLHTNFALSGGGEYLALVKPDGLTVASAFAPEFPQQSTDVSYGLDVTASTTTLIASGATAKLLVPTSAALGTTWTARTFNDASWTSGTTGVGYERSSGYESLIGTSVEAQTYNTIGSVYIRVPFNVTDPASIAKLSLKMKYDDGFAVYVNGQPITAANRNVPDPLVWNSAASSPHDDAAAVSFEPIDLTVAIPSLVSGINVLAIQGLNTPLTSSDFLILPELEATSVQTLPNQLKFFTTPTPGAPNVPGVEGIVDEVRFSHEHGFYSDPFSVSIANDTAGAVIRYTINGSAPTATTGAVYTGPIPISGTTTLRAAAFMQGHQPSTVITQTYLFLDQVIRQPANPPGFPAQWGGAAADYEMDPNVVNNPLYAGELKSDLLSIPSFSIVMDMNDLFSPSTGIYSNPTAEGVAWERASSIELIYPDGREGFQVNSGARIQGGVGRVPSASPKHSFRFLFKDEYGPTRLKFDLFGDGATQSLDTITLRAGFNNTWHFSPTDEQIRAQYIRDQWMRDAQLDMGQASPHGTYVHLYVNGVYWGLYNVVERPSAQFAAEYYGGEKEDYDALNSSNPVDGDKNAWNTMMGLANAGLSTDAQYQAIQQYLDVPNLIDYMILNIYGGNLDWDDHNWYAARKREPGTGYKFFSWDAERVLESVNEDRSEINQNDKPSRLYAALRGNSEFRLLFADHVQTFLFNGGALTPQANIDRWMARANEINGAIVGESARWGDYRREPPYTRNAEWLAEQNRLITQYFPQRTSIVLNQFRADGLYPNVAAPAYNQQGGKFNNLFNLTITAPAGTIYYTLDGSDPRLYGGGISPLALVYTGPVALTRNTVVKARALSGAAWSAVNEATFAKEDSALRISEVMYHAADPAIGSPYTGDDFDYLELYNSGATTIDLAGAHFTQGIDAALANVQLAPGQYAVLVKNQAAFQSRYGAGITIVGVFTGNLDNAGERLKLENILAQPLADFTISDQWQPISDGGGFSLVPINPASNPSGWSAASAWRASGTQNGSPGAADIGLAPGSVVINELSANASGAEGDWVELVNTTGSPINIGLWYLSDSATELTRFQIPAGTVIPEGGYLLLNQRDHFGNANHPGTTAAFGFSNAGEAVHLTSLGSNNQPGGYRESAAFDGSDADVSFGRFATSTGVDFTTLLTPTPGAANALPKIGPVVINEVMYNPAGGGDEYIELLNLTPQQVALYDPARPANTWKFIDGITFTFPVGAAIAANGYALVVPVAPGAFRTKYNIPAAVPIYGPYTSVLDNGGEKLTLAKPGVPDAQNVVPYIDVDVLRYEDDPPWPPQSDAAGSSLSRLEPANYTNDVANWLPSTAGGSPGAQNAYIDTSPPTVPAITSAMVVSASRIDLAWTASSPTGATGVASYRIYRNGGLIGAVNSTTTTYSDTLAAPATAYQYRVSAVNGDGAESDKSPAAAISILVLDSALPISGTQVRIVFSEAVVKTQAETPANYAIGGVNVLTASLAADNKTLTLTTSALANGQKYMLSVSNVAGTAGGRLVVPTQTTFTPGVQLGLQGSYFNNMTLTGQATATRFDPVVDFDWGSGQPHPSIGADFFSVRWTGFVLPQYTQSYTFSTVSDDGVRLWVNNVALINNWTDHGPTTDSGSISLVAGQAYAIRMEMYENGGGAVARLLWSSASQPTQTIPVSRLFVSQAADVTPPRVISAGFEASAAPPALRLQFLEDVSASLTTADLTLTNLTLGANIQQAAMSLAYDASTNTARVTFPGLAGGKLPAGNYQARLTATGIRDAANNALDGNGDGAPGDDYTLNFTAAAPTLRGDMNGDTAVNNLDIAPFALALTNPAAYATQYPAINANVAGDINQDASFNNLDIGPFAQLLTAAPASPAGISMVVLDAGVGAAEEVKAAEQSTDGVTVLLGSEMLKVRLASAASTTPAIDNAPASRAWTQHHLAAVDRLFAGDGSTWNRSPTDALARRLVRNHAATRPQVQPSDAALTDLLATQPQQTKRRR